MTDSTSPGPTWTPGRQIGSYLLLREIARGGMGEIWLALDRSGGQVERLVVIKRVLHAAETDPQHVTLFLDEARIAAQLNHPNVVQVFTMGEVEGSHYLVMEYLPGQALGRVVRTAWPALGVLPPAHAVQIALGGARGLGYAHRRKGLTGQPLRIVHRDVSPQNLLVTYDGHVKVLDFGIALAEGRLSRTATGLIRGKLQYMSPEQALSLPVGPPSDVFALGIVLWELLSGRRFYGKVEELAVLRVLTMGADPFPDVRTVAPHVDEELATIVATALARDPDARYADGVVFAEALERWLAAHPFSESLETLMQRLFGEEIAALPQLHEALSATPAAPQQRELPTVSEQPTRASATPGQGGAAAAGAPVAAPPALPVPPPPSSARRATLVALLAAALLIVGGGGGYLAARETATATGPSVVSPTTPPTTAPPTTAPPTTAPPTTVPPTTVPPTTVPPTTVPPTTVPPTSAPTTTPVLPGAQVAPAFDATGAGSASAALVATDAGVGATARRSEGRGTLSIDTQPWTRVLLGKKVLGETPLVEVPVPAGALRLRLVNEREGVDTFVDVAVKPGEGITKQYRLK